MKFEGEPGTKVGGTKPDGTAIRTIVFDEKGVYETTNEDQIRILEGAGFKGKEVEAKEGKE